MRHNEGEIEEFLKVAEKIGVDRKNIISPCVRTPQQAKDFLPKSDIYWIYERERFEREGCLSPRKIIQKLLSLALLFDHHTGERQCCAMLP